MQSKVHLQPTTDFLGTGPRHHFFLTNLQEWRKGYDLAGMATYFRRRQLPFLIFLVPGPTTENYELRNFIPDVPDLTPILHFREKQ